MKLFSIILYLICCAFLGAIGGSLIRLADSGMNKGLALAGTWLAFCALTALQRKTMKSL